MNLNYPQLTSEEEISLGKKSRAGDKQARDQLVLCNLKFAKKLAYSYAKKTRNIDVEDLEQEAYLGLIKAAEEFDPEKGYRFLTYAVWWIRQKILAAITRENNLIRIPLHVVNRRQQLFKLKLKLEQGLKRKASNEELDNFCGYSDIVEQIIIVSLDDPMGDFSENTIKNYICNDKSATPDKHLWDKTLISDIEKILAALTERERLIIKLYHGLSSDNFTLEEIGNILGLTRERIRQIKKDTLTKIKKKSEGILKPHLDG